MQFISKQWNVGLMGMALASALLAGCGGEGFDGTEGTDLAEAGESINRGTLITNNNAPWSSVVRLNSSNGTCTATKLNDNQFLTAAHCVRRTNCTYLGFFNTVEISNALDATAAGTSVTLEAVYVHPSYKYNPDVCAGDPASPYSYDIAILEFKNNPLPSIPNAPAFSPDHVPVGTLVRQVGYGGDFANANRLKKKQYADYVSANEDYFPASFAHTIRTFSAQSASGGDSGGPLFREASPGNWLIVGVSTATLGNAAEAQSESWYSRVANVGGWIKKPHNDSTTTDGIGFLQSIGQRKCMFVQNSSAGTAPRLGECEGYSQTLHGHVWELVASGTGVQFRTKKSGVTRCLDMSGNTNNVVLANCGAGQGQQWILTAPSGNAGVRTVRNRLRNLYLNDNASGGLTVSSTQKQWLYYR